MNIRQLMEELEELRLKSKTALEESAYLWNHNLEEVEHDSSDPEQQFLMKQAGAVMPLLQAAYDRLEYLSLSVEKVGTLHEKGDQLFLDGVHLSCGDMLEIMDEDEDGNKLWILTHVEADSNGKYYLFGLSNEEQLEGNTCRIRWSY